jgi:hypothetical protein
MNDMSVKIRTRFSMPFVRRYSCPPFYTNAEVNELRSRFPECVEVRRDILTGFNDAIVDGYL